MWRCCFGVKHALWLYKCLSQLFYHYLLNIGWSESKFLPDSHWELYEATIQEHVGCSGQLNLLKSLIKLITIIIIQNFLLHTLKYTGESSIHYLYYRTLH